MPASIENKWNLTYYEMTDAAVGDLKAMVGTII